MADRLRQPAARRRKSGKPGALDLPDLFSAHPADAEALGVEALVDWNDWFSAEEMAAYVPGFVQDGVIAGKQIVFPVSKSTQLLFLNGSQYARFAADTGAQLEKLDTWNGFFEMAAAYRQWSQGKPFCALDSPLRFHNRNIYTKLGINSLKQLQQCIAVLHSDGTGTALPEQLLEAAEPEKKEDELPMTD